MARRIHIHITRDAGWNENDHPRAENGQFGSGGGKKLSTERLDGAGKPDAKGEFVKNPLAGEVPHEVAKTLGEMSRVKALKFYSKKTAIDPSEVSSRQRVVKPDVVKKYMQDPNAEADHSRTGKSARPKVMKVDGKLYVDDGNHRVAAAALAGRKIEVDLIDVDQATKEAKEVMKRPGWSPYWALGYAIEVAAQERKAKK